MKNAASLFLTLLFCLFAVSAMHAQSARLGVQGILKKANGNAVDDGNYDLTFKIYNVASSGSALWTETQPGVEVASGVYTATLGSVTALNIPFNETYYLGVTVGGPSGVEMSPRIQLTTAPYALSLIGNTNQFPSSGKVIADSLVVKGKMGVGQATLPTTQSLQVNGGLLARGGSPGASGANNNGYAFTGGPGRSGTGLFSNVDSTVSLYVNNTEMFRVSRTAATNNVNMKTNTLIDNSLTISDQLLVSGFVSSNLNMNNQKSLAYNNGTTTMNDWRLVDRDDFLGGSLDNWQCTTAILSGTASNIESVDYGAFNGYVIRPQGASNTPSLKKLYNLSGIGSFTWVKIRFKYYFTDSWDQSNEIGVGGFSTDLAGSDPVICWQQSAQVYAGSGPLHYTGSGSYSDGATVGEMIANINSANLSSFYVFFGMKSDDDTGNERWALSNVEVWVR